MRDQDRLYGTTEIAALLQVSPRTVRSWIYKGFLKAIRYTPRSPYKIKFADVQAMMNKCRHRRGE